MFFLLIIFYQHTNQNKCHLSRGSVLLVLAVGLDEFIEFLDLCVFALEDLSHGLLVLLEFLLVLLLDVPYLEC
jgi:hypothetical protein